MRSNKISDWFFVVLFAASFVAIAISAFGYWGGYWSNPRKHPELLTPLGLVMIGSGISGLLTGGYAKKLKMDRANIPVRFWVFTYWLLASGACVLFVGVAALLRL